MPSSVVEQPLILRPPAELLEQHPELRHAGADLARKYAGHELVTEEDLKRIGQRLWEVLDHNTAFEQALDNAGIHILPLVLASEHAAIQQLPWETLYHPEHGFLGKSPRCTLSRCLPGNAGIPAGTGRLEAGAPRGPLRVLLFTSLPDDLKAETGRLNVEEEQIQVQEALMPWIGQGLVELEMPDDGVRREVAQVFVNT